MALTVLALVAWVIAAISAVQVVRLTPAGTRWRNYTRLGWWQFDEIRREAGAAIDLPARTYRRAFVTFGLCVVLLVVLSLATSFSSPAVSLP